MAGSNDDKSTGEEVAPRFRALWLGLSDIMGTSATATLLRRAAKHEPHVTQLVVQKPAFEYEYITPTTWRDPQIEARAMRTLLQALEPLLVELTGEIVITRLRDPRSPSAVIWEGLMSRAQRPEIKLESTGAVELDEILGGRLPSRSVVMIVGEPGSGKTVLTHQLLSRWAHEAPAASAAEPA